LDLVIIQNFCASNNTTQKVKGPTEWEKYLMRGLYSQYNLFCNLIIKR
jgi:hypothetical protein